MRKWLEFVDREMAYNMIFIGLAILCFGQYMFWAGFHNTDVCRNEEKISLMYDIDIKEQKLTGEAWDLDMCIVQGLKQEVIGVYICIIGAFILGLARGGIKYGN